MYNSELIATYQNGNTKTILYNDGTKIHVTDEDDFKYSYAESCDIQVSQCCDNGCEFCYAGCSPTGKHGDLTSWKFLHTMHPYTEVAINLQFPTPPNLMEFLYTMKAQNVFVNVTINQKHFMSSYGRQFVKFLATMNLIKGIGISLIDPTEDGFIDAVKEFPNTVVHVIAGVVKQADIKYMMDKDLKLLILGYKHKGRGTEFYKNHMSDIEAKIYFLEQNIMEYADHFEVVSFDNLALKQLHMGDKLSDEEWEVFYAGDDGTVTFYIDLVNGTFARSSLSEIHYPIGELTIDEMFQVIQKEVENETTELS